MKLDIISAIYLPPADGLPYLAVLIDPVYGDVTATPCETAAEADTSIESSRRKLEELLPTDDEEQQADLILGSRGHPLAS